MKLFGTPGLRPTLTFLFFGNGLTGFGLLMGDPYSSPTLFALIGCGRLCSPRPFLYAARTSSGVALRLDLAVREFATAGGLMSYGTILPTTIVKSASDLSLWMFRRGARSTMVAAACGATGRTFDWHLGDKAAVDTVFARTTKKAK